MRELTDSQWQTVANNIPLIEAAAKGWAYSAIGDDGLAYDAAFTAMCDAVATHDASTLPLAGWFRTILQRRVIDAVRAKYRHPTEDYSPAEIADPRSEASATGIELVDMLSRLDGLARRVVEDIHLNGYTFQQIADREGMNKDSVYRMYLRSIKFLKRVAA